MYITPSTWSLVAGLFVPLVTAGSDYVLTVYREADCRKVDGDDNSFMDWHTFDSSDDHCQSGDMIPTDDWKRNTAGQYQGYIRGDGLESDCKVGILSQADVEPDKCGNVISVIDGAKSHNCVQVYLSENFGTIYCCGDQCDEYGLNNAKRSHARDLLASTPGLLSLSPRGDSTARHQGGTPRDNNNDKRDKTCKWNSSGGGKQKKRSDTAERLTGDQGCESADGCTLSNSAAVSWEATETFGISTEVGASFFDIVSASMSLSYEYSYSHGATNTVTYSYNQAQGITGHLIWYQYYWCDDGYFTGSCDESQVSAKANAGQPGSVCIPAEDSSGRPDGYTGFLASL